MKRFFYLLPVLLHRLTGWLPLQPKTGEVQFANIGDGIYPDGKKSYIADATAVTSPVTHFLLYKKSTAPPAGTNAADYVTLTVANADIPLGQSDDGAKTVGDLLAINLLGAVTGTLRVVTDGTAADGDYLMPSAVTPGYAAKFAAGAGNRCIGKAIIPSDGTGAAGDIINFIPNMPLNNPGV